MLWCGQRRSGQRLVAVGIRFCAYVKTARYEGVRHRRTTPGAPFPSLVEFLCCVVCVSPGSGSPRRAGHHRPGETSHFRTVNYALIRTEGPTRASVVTYLVPLVSLTLGAAALGEPLSPNRFTGAALILTGIAISRYPASNSDGGRS
ncbi:MAG: EamA family transporter [Pseudonocardiaceae bacterium]